MKSKILFIDSYFDCLYGAQKSMLNLAVLLKDRDHEITIATTASGKLIKEAKTLGLNTSEFSVSKKALVSITSLNSILSYIVYLFSVIFSWAKSFHYYNFFRDKDTICVNDIRCFIYYFPLIVLFKRKVIWYVRVREEQLTLVRFFSIFCRKIAFVSKDLYKDFKDLNIPVSKMHVVHTGFPNPQNEMMEYGNSLASFVSVGSICERKNQLELLDLFYTIHSTTGLNYKLTLIGGVAKGQESYYKSVTEKIENNEYLAKYVNILGYCDFVEIELEKHDVFLFSSLREGLPRCLIEALQAGLFIVTRKVEGVDDIILNNRLGYVYESNYFDVVDKLQESLQSGYCFSKGEKAFRRRYVKDNFSEVDFINNFLSL
ncbi:glycosyltransferase [Vibrio splendidus]